MSRRYIETGRQAVWTHYIDSALSPSLICDPRRLVNTIMFPEVPTIANINSFISKNSSSLFDTQHQFGAGWEYQLLVYRLKDNACNVSLDNDLEKWPIMD